MLKKLWDFLWAPFSWDQESRSRDLDDVLTPIDVDEVVERFELADAAERYGSQEIPNSDDTTLDGPQRRIRQFMEDRITEAYRLASQERTKLVDAMRGRDIFGLVSRARSLPNRVRGEIESEVRKASRNLDKLKFERQSVAKRIRTYQQKYEIDRPPDLRDSSERRTLVTFTLLLAVAQAVANGFFFAEGMRYGLSMGLVVAVIIGLFDVLAHAFIGRQGGRITAPNLPNRLLGGMFSTVMVCTVPIWNLGLVHLRLAVREHGLDQGAELWGQRFLAEPFGFSDFYSFVLLGIGLLCSGLAVATGWNWDEKIPLFREEGRRLEEINDEIEHWQDEKAVAVQAGERRGREGLEELSDSIEHNVEMIQRLFDKLASLRDNVFVFTDKMEHAYKAAIQFYRDENRVARSSSPPPYFRDEPEIEFERPLDLDLTEPREFKERQVQLKQEFKEEEPRIRDKLADLAVAERLED